MLCRVTASTIMVVRPSLLSAPPPDCFPHEGGGIRWSSKKKNSTPTQKPIKAGRKDSFPHILRLLNGGDQQAPDGCRHHHPGGKTGKGSAAPDRQGIFFIKNTQAAPSVVPKKGIMIPRKVSICLTAFALRFLFVSSEARLIPVFGMFFYIRVLIAADGIVASAAVPRR